MTDLVVVVPSRGRPEAARALADAFAATCTADTQLVFALDDDDRTVDQYCDARYIRDAGTHTGTHTSMVQALNNAAAVTLGIYGPFALGFMGDDHFPHTHGWDSRYLEALREFGTGIVYGNDLLQGANLPTQCAMTSDIVRALGYMAPPTLRHMYVDNFWLDLGTAAGCIRYLPDVIVEHRHPIAGKARWDEGYLRVNASSVYAADAEAYKAYRAERFDADVAKVRGLRG